MQEFFPIARTYLWSPLGNLHKAQQLILQIIYIRSSEYKIWARQSKTIKYNISTKFKFR